MLIGKICSFGKLSKKHALVKKQKESGRRAQTRRPILPHRTDAKGILFFHAQLAYANYEGAS